MRLPGAWLRVRAVMRQGHVVKYDCTSPSVVLDVEWATDPWALEACHRCAFASGNVQGNGTLVKLKIYTTPPIEVFACVEGHRVLPAYKFPDGIPEGTKICVLAPRDLKLRDPDAHDESEPTRRDKQQHKAPRKGAYAWRGKPVHTHV